MTEITVYFDGACPLCAREIAYYRRRRGADRLNWVDVSALLDEDVADGLSKSDALARFHIRTPGGRIVSGGLAFAHLWDALPSFRPLGRLFLTAPMSRFLDLGYNLFLRFRPLLQRVARRQLCRCDAQDGRL